ncbi:hypothetical protein M378DRAFT_156521 [Amanita muscaria Koide BX008]|uniref:Uncharacterized protein n=1 Tax=Amanita muscaria (strain Koide BX008) TaxID=946122 RepID=A0A0C2XMM8_AMAMK|nr:hypothetical protein M378DRAFT_156521 [Amanita muscaria Koide BX008]
MLRRSINPKYVREPSKLQRQTQKSEQTRELEPIFPIYRLMTYLSLTDSIQKEYLPFSQKAVLRSQRHDL